MGNTFYTRRKMKQKVKNSDGTYSTIMDINIDELVLLDSVQSRVGLTPEVVEDYANKYRNEIELPPLQAVKDSDGEYILCDGFHRLKAARDAGLETIRITYTEGTVDDAKYYSMTANTDHGLQRSNADKRKAILMAFDLEVTKNLSDRLIADLLMVSHPLVAKIRQETEAGQVEIFPPEAGQVEIFPRGGRETGQDSEYPDEGQVEIFPPEVPDCVTIDDPPPSPKPSERSKVTKTRKGKDGKKYPIKEDKAVKKKQIAAEPEYLVIKIPLPLHEDTVYKILFDTLGKDMMDTILDMYS
jgi:hypothetical protein